MIWTKFCKLLKALLKKFEYFETKSFLVLESYDHVKVMAFKSSKDIVATVFEVFGKVYMRSNFTVKIVSSPTKKSHKSTC